MRLVAAAKVRRAQEQVLCTRPFADALAQVLYNLQGRLAFSDVNLPLLAQREVKTVALLVVTGDRGLCGGYNTNVIRRAEQRMNELKEQGINYQLVLPAGKRHNISSAGMLPLPLNLLTSNRFPLPMKLALLGMNYFPYFYRKLLIASS